MGLVSKYKASSEHIFRHLCDQMDKLNMKVINVEEAKAQANLCKQANNLLKFELDRAKFVEKFGSEHIRNIEHEKDEAVPE